MEQELEQVQVQVEVEEAKATFADLGLSELMLKALGEMGFEEPSPIQERTIPLLLQGRDVIGQAQTGTGKTAAFGVPIVEKLDRSVRGIQALILTPTRELAIQVAEEMLKIGKHHRVRTAAIYGGQAIERQLRVLRLGVDVVIGTPGRVMDHIRRGTLKLDNVKMAILDEADEMLDMGFVEDIEWVFQQLPPGRQTLLFSATMPTEIKRLAVRYMNNPEHVIISPNQLTVPQVEQYFVEVRLSMKTEALCRIIDIADPERSICFCRTKRGVDELVEALQARGYQAEGIHGDMNQAQRSRVMQKFRDAQMEILVATDVAARGLDINDVTHVFNYDIPQDPESYVHRIGRTGRAGKSGTAITLISTREFGQLRLIERAAKTHIERRALPSVSDVAERQREMLKGRVIKTMEDGRIALYKELAEELLDEFDPADLLAAALKLATGERDAEPETVDFGDTGAEPGMVRLFLNVGRQQLIQPADIVRSIAAQTGIAGSAIGLINIYDRFTFVEVPVAVASQVMQGMKESTIKGRTVNVEPAKRR